MRTVLVEELIASICICRYEKCENYHLSRRRFPPLLNLPGFRDWRRVGIHGFPVFYGTDDQDIG